MAATTKETPDPNQIEEIRNRLKYPAKGYTQESWEGIVKLAYGAELVAQVMKAEPQSSKEPLITKESSQAVKAITKVLRMGANQSKSSTEPIQPETPPEVRPAVSRGKRKRKVPEKWAKPTVSLEELRKHVYSAKALDAKEVKPLEYIIDSLLVEQQVTVIGGRRGVGKSLIVMQMCISLALGKDFLGRKVKKPYRVAYMDLENGLALDKERSYKQRMEAGMTDAEKECLEKNWNLYDGLELGSENMSLFLETYKPEILFIDNLGQVFEETKDEELTKEFVRNLEALRKEYGLDCIILLHHVIKLTGDKRPSLLFSPNEYLECIRGSGRLLDYVPSRLAIAEEFSKEGSYCVVNGCLRGGVIVPLIIQLNQDTLSFELESETEFLMETFFGKAEKQGEFIRSLMTKFPNGFTTTEAEKSADKLSHRTVVKALNKANGSFLEKVGRGFYKWRVKPELGYPSDTPRAKSLISTPPKSVS